MKLFFEILIFICCYSSTFMVFLTPNVLEPPIANSVICRNPRIEGLIPARSTEQIPYIKCVNEAILKITSATLKLSSPQDCPLQFVRPRNVPTCPTNNFANSDVTKIFNTLCNVKEACVFSFDAFPPLLCLSDPAKPPVTTTEIPAEFLSISVTYRCQTPRRRFRPFSNKRYNMKFTRTINHPIRKLSYNHLMAL